MDVSKELKAIENEINSLERRLTALRSTGGGANHNILSSTHLDSLAASVVRGDVIIGNSTPRWARLAKGTDGQYLRMNGNDPAWQDQSGGSVSESDIQFLDNFDDADIWWGWNVSHTDANKVITEPSSGVINIAVNSGTNANWWSTVNNAPRLLTGVPGFPLMIETKITSWNSNSEEAAGCCFSRYDGNANYSHIATILSKSTLGVIELLATYAGGNFASVSPYTGGLPVWLRVYLNCFGRYNQQMFFYYSTDGSTWNEIGTGPYGNATWSNDYGITCGIFAKNWGAFPAVDTDFEHFIARRFFGPG